MQLQPSDRPLKGDGYGDQLIDLDHARVLDVHRWSEHPEVNLFVDKIYEYLIKLGRERIGVPKRKHIKVLLLDLYVAWYEDSELLIALDRTLSAYKPKSRYNALNISRTMILVLDLLSDAGLVDWVKGFKDTRAGGRSRNSKIWATPLLVFHFQDALYSIFDIHSTDKRELIVMHEKQTTEYKNKDGKVVKQTKSVPVEYKDSPKIQKMRDVVSDYNTLLHFHHIDLSNIDKRYVEILKTGTSTLNERGRVVGYMDLEYQEHSENYKTVRRVNINHDSFTHRVFNNRSFKQGGRFYGGWWQRIPSEYRKFIRINGFPTVELDYSSHHPVLLYAKLGLNYWKEFGEQDDPYDLKQELGDKYLNAVNHSYFYTRINHNRSNYAEGQRKEEQRKAERDLIKTLMLTAVNARSETDALSGARKTLYEQNGDQYTEKYNPLDDNLMGIYLKAIKEKHRPIRKYLGSGIGLELQYIDSQITEGLVKYFTMKEIPLLMIHDSYLIWEEFAWDLKFQMYKEWSKFTGLPENEVTELFESISNIRFGDGTIKKFKTKKPMPLLNPTSEIKPPSNHYVSRRHKQDLKKFKSWRAREDIQGSMRFVLNENNIDTFKYMQD